MNDPKAKKQTWSREEVKRALGELVTREVISGGYSTGHYIENSGQVREIYKRSELVDLDELLEAFGISTWKDWNES